MKFSSSTRACWVTSLGFLTLVVPTQADVKQDGASKTVLLTDGSGQLSLRLNYAQGLALDRITVRGREVAGTQGTLSGVQVDGKWLTTGKTLAAPRIKLKKNELTVSGISYGPAAAPIRETWNFKTQPDRIVWKISRTYPGELTLQDSALPRWNFASMKTWTGGMLDNGGVVWSKYLENSNATYGAQARGVSLWNREKNDVLRITPTQNPGLINAVRFSHQPVGQGAEFTFNASQNREEFKPKHNRNRFLWDHQDLWSPFKAQAGQEEVELSLEALSYDEAYDRGTFKGLNGASVRELLNTVGRYGVIDDKHIGTNGWRSGYICLHEPWLAQIGMAVDDPDYTANFARTLDYWRDYAVKPDGRVLSRWKYDAGDAMGGTYNDKGFYEAQWGYLMDSQTDYIINVAQQFAMSGDTKWLAGQKEVCERVLQYLLKREVGNSGLVAMQTDSHTQARGSDWFDIVWASYENALVNAKLYRALTLWSEAEEVLGDKTKATNYADFAQRLKTTFNKPTSAGGFWSPENKWYVYWRDKDGSIHGDNQFTAVNFAAIGYGICDDKTRQKAILDGIETQMVKENLFHWPTNFISFRPGEGANGRYPDYENGDIFLGWGALAVRAYANYDPAIAVKYVEKTLAKYEEDGLSFQRYLRGNQKGAGDDILANNCLAIVGLYNEIYGIHPEHDRLYLEPHITPELSGTTLRYKLRGHNYEIGLNTAKYSIRSGGVTFQSATPFAVNATDAGLQFFGGSEKLEVAAAKGKTVDVEVTAWGAERQWKESSSTGGSVQHVISGLTPGEDYSLSVGGKKSVIKADAGGVLQFRSQAKAGKVLEIVLRAG